MTDLTDKVALVIGAGHGAGSQVARHLEGAGATVALNDLVPNPIEDLAAELGGNAQAFAADASKKLSLQGLVQDVLEAYERIDILVFAAEVQPAQRLLEMDEWDWRHSLDMNLNAAFLALQSVGRVLRQLGGGDVLLLVDHADSGVAPSAAYRTASAALAALAESAAEQLAEDGIRVQALPAADAERILDYLDSTN